MGQHVKAAAELVGHGTERLLHRGPAGHVTLEEAGRARPRRVGLGRLRGTVGGVDIERGDVGSRRDVCTQRRCSDALRGAGDDDLHPGEGARPGATRLAVGHH